LVLNETTEENTKLKEELDKLRVEVGDIKAAVALTESGRQDDVFEMERKYQEEISSLQHIMDGKSSVVHRIILHAGDTLVLNEQGPLMLWPWPLLVTSFAYISFDK
jgi:hypothetical protein